MNAVRTATLLLVCLGLVLPTAPGIAICIGDAGDVDVGTSTHSACRGRESDACERSTDVCESQRGLEAVDESRDCRDVILRRDFATSPPKPASEKHRSQHLLGDAVGVAECRGERDAIPIVGVTPGAACRAAALRSLSTVVLRL